MRRAVPAMFLGAAALVLGLFTIFLCASNRQRAAELDSLVREIDHLVLHNARTRAAVDGHAPGFSSHGDAVAVELEH